MPFVCPNCKQNTSLPYLCKSCDILLPADDSVNYFNLLSVSPAYSVNSTQIEEGYEALIVDLHPDFFEHKGAEQKSLSLSWSAFAKQARDTLLHPQQRAQYIYRLKFSDANKISDPSQDFIMNMFELNDKLENADSADSELVRQTLASCEKFEMRCAEIFDALVVSDDSSPLRKESEQLLGEFKFWLNICEIANSLQTANG